MGNCSVCGEFDCDVDHDEDEDREADDWHDDERDE